MAKRHPHETAARLAGDLYGKILNRNADRDGYAYVLDSLQQGKRSVRQHALEMIASSEFAKAFLAARNPQDSVKLLNRILLARELPDPLLTLEAERYNQIGLTNYAAQLTELATYKTVYGEDLVPGRGH